MLYEAGLPSSFIGEAVNAYITVQNRCPTNSLSEKTPYELWYKRKPNVSNLRIWGCAAYVHIQKDRHTGIGSHMEKCIFIGYPEGFKAWRFYNPITKCIIISERAEFDEHYFPGLKHAWNLPKVNLALPLIISEYQTPTQIAQDHDEEDSESRPSTMPSPTLSQSPITPTTSISPETATPDTRAMSPSGPPSVITTISAEPSLPSLLQRRAANPRRNAGVPPKQWWTSWEPTEATHIGKESDNLNNGPDEDNEVITTALSTRYTDLQTYKEAMGRTDA